MIDFSAVINFRIFLFNNFYQSFYTENYEVLKALYDFKATFAKTLSFQEGDYFILYQSNTKQRNWWQVVNKDGQIGYIPSNYVTTVKVMNYYNK